MKKNYIARRRGTSVAAAALSFALVAPLAQPVAFAQDVPAVEAGVEAPAEAQGKNQLVPNAVYTRGGWRDFYGYHGYAYINKQGRADDQGDEHNEPLKGNVIYLQYVTGKGEVSPVFYTLTDPEGRFSFDLSESVTNEYDAPAFHLAGDSNFRVRVWGENPDPEKYSVVMAGDMNSGRYTTRTERIQESWNYTAGPSGSRITNGRFVLEEKPNHVGWLAKPEKDWTRALDGETGQPTVDGQFPDYGAFGTIKSIAAPNQSMVWWENGENAGSLPGYYAYQPKQGDRAAGGVEIVASYLNDEVAREIDAWKDANKGYTAEQERENQERIIKAYQDEHGEGSHIAETVVVPSKDDGTIYLPFKGTYGVSRTQENQTAQTRNLLEAGDFGKVAESFMPENDGGTRYGAFSGGRVNSTKRRHINSDYMYIYPRIEGRDVKNSAFPMNMFQNYTDQGGMGAGFDMDGLQFPLMTAQPIFDIPEYNSYDNKGRAGSKVTTKTAGLVPNADYAIRWFATGPDGKQEELTDAMCKFKSDDKGVIPSCDFQAPEDLKKTTVYTAAVVSVDPTSGEPNDRWEIADSFTAVVPEQLPLGSKYDAYSADEVASLFSDLPKEKAQDAEPKYSAKDDLPDGLEIDPETGKITGKPTNAGTTEVIVTRTVDVEVERHVPVLEENGNPVYENPGEPDPEKRVVKTERKTVTTNWQKHVVTKIVVTDTPLADGVVGEKYSQEVKPEGFGALPQGFELKKDSIKVEGLPAGLEFKDGKITGTPTEKAVEASEEKPNVTVTYTLVDQDGNETEHTDMVPLSVGVKTTVDESGKKPVDPTDEKQGSGVIVNNPDDDTKVTAKDEDGKDVPAVINPETGEIGLTPGKDVDGPITVTITDPDLDGGKVDIEVPVNGHKKGVDDNGSDKMPENPIVTPGDNTTVPADGGEHNVGKVENPNGDEKGKLVDKDGKEIPGSKVEIDEDGNVKVTVPEGTDPQDAKVIVTDKDGNPIGEIDVRIVDPRSDASINVPNYGDRKNVEAGKTEKSDPFEGKTDVPVKEAKGKPSEGSEDWTFKTGETNGVVEATAPDYDKVAEKIKSELPNIDSSWEKFKKIFTLFARPSVDVDFEYNDGSKNSATADFDLVGKDGKSLLDPDGDFDGDGISNKDEIEGGTNPAAADEGDIRDTTAPLINQVKPGDRKITGKGDRPGEDISVTIPGVKDPIRTTTDKDGNWSVDVPTDIDLNSEDRIRVSDEAGNTTETAVGPAALEPLLTDQFDPVYPRAYVRVGESATSVTPNLTRYINGREFRRQPLRTAGEVTFKVESPGTLKDNGRVEVTAPKDAQPGDLITVPVLVTYEDGTTDKTEAIFEVIPGAYAEMYDPKYEVGRSASPGEQTQVKQVGDNDLPEGTTFTLDRDKSDLNGWGIQVDETTGLITATAPQSREHRAEVVVTVSYADGSQQSITAFVDPQAATSMAETIPVKDALVTVPVGVALDANVVPALPDGTTFDIGAFSDENWSVDVNKDTGEVMVVTTDKVQPNDQVVVPVVVKFPDGSETTVNVTVVATKPQTTQHQPVYVASKVAPGERTSLQLEVPLDKKVGATYSLAGNAAGLKAEIDPETGVITVQADAGAKPGTRVLPVDVRYADGSVERIQARVEVTGTGVTANPACDHGSSNSSTSSTSSTSSESCNTGSSTGGVIAIILGVLAVIGGAAWAAFINQDAVRDVLRNFGIKF
ncbi:YPDG domain-containing protein [Corynebacterium coyleae]|uniref:YPDG domain-containing protein n=1 Tax=Corynebacterium coyleae TaxID=53374 RepID=UPI00254E88A5|nr:YPDG domain-containing protein [Corynebacterium coyleae]MDK8242006.1 YPDG domain-containing protein [Corynebacterium coyleae]